MTPRRYTFDASGIAAIILAAALGLGWSVSIIIAALPITDPISETGAALLNGIGQVLAGAIATFLGSQIRRPSETPQAPVSRVQPPSSGPDPNPARLVP